MIRQIKIDVSDTYRISERIVGYFKEFDFKLIEQKDGCLKFGRKSTLIDAWKVHPLRWGSEISISISDNSVIADFDIDTEIQMMTMEEEAVWQTFIENFREYLTSGVISNQKLNSAILDNRKSRSKYLGWLGLGAFVGGLISVFLSKLTNTDSFVYMMVIVPFFIITLLIWRIRYTKTKNASRQ